MALHKPAYQVSTWSTANASSAVDGMPTRDSCTGHQFVQPWWAVDIGQQAIVKVVYVINNITPAAGELLHNIQ